MAKIDLDSLNIEELATLRDRVIEKLAEKVATRQTELAAEMDRLAQQYGRPTRKSQGKSEGKSEAKSQDTAAVAKSKRSGEAEQRTTSPTATRSPTRRDPAPIVARWDYLGADTVIRLAVL